MIEKVLKGGRLYWAWIAFLLVIIAIGFAAYLVQYDRGLSVTGMGKEVSWGLYIANFTFLVGVAASAVMVALPAYLYNYKKFKKLTTIGEFLAVAAVIMCILFILVDLGRPQRVLHVVVHPTPNSVMFFDTIVLSGYLILNLVIAWFVLSAKQAAREPNQLVKLLIYIAIPWAFSIHTVTAFLYSGLVARGFWNTAVMAPRFLASAFAAGPAFLILALLVAKRYANFDPGRDAIRKLLEIVTFAMIANLFLLGCELFTAFYSAHPAHLEHFVYLLFGLEGYGKLVPWIRLSLLLGLASVALLVYPRTRHNEYTLALACALVFVSIWIDKGMGLIIPGYIPSQVGTIEEYWPSLIETLIALGVWGIGLLIFTVLAKMAIEVTKETEAYEGVF